MRRRPSAALLVVAASLVAGIASAHAIDAVVEQTTLAFGADTVTIHLFLTPGSERAEAFVREVDTDGDGAFSADETKRWNESLQHDLAVSLDGRPLTLTSTAIEVPEIAAIHEGVGVVALDFTAPLGSPDDTLHSLAIENRHAVDGAVYLANVIPPASPTLTIVSQTRNEPQSIFRVGYRRAGKASARGWLWLGLAAGVVLAGVAFVFHRRRA